MVVKQRSRTRPRVPLSRQRVLRTAIKLADEGGIESLSMRNVAHELGVYPMALYNHFANKDDLLDAMVDVMYEEIDVTAGGSDWKGAMRQQANSIREVLARHRWALGVIQSRVHPGPGNMRYHDMVIRALRQAGFSVAMAVHAFTLLENFIFGFALLAQTHACSASRANTRPCNSKARTRSTSGRSRFSASSPLTTIPTSPSPLPSTWARPATTSPASSTSVSI